MLSDGSAVSVAGGVLKVGGAVKRRLREGGEDDVGQSSNVLRACWRQVLLSLLQEQHCIQCAAST